MNYVPVVAGTFSNDFVGKQGVSESSTSSQQDQDCIIMPIWNDASYFGDDAPRSVADAKKTAEASTDTDGEVTITAIIDGQSKTITEASLRSTNLSILHIFVGERS
ncbi:hypothetical protein Tco_1012972 [Tanacetum coccineum]